MRARRSSFEVREGCGRRRIPDDMARVGPELLIHRLLLLLTEDMGRALLPRAPAGEFILRGLKVRQLLLPVALEPAGDEPVVQVEPPCNDALGAAASSSRAFGAQSPLLKRPTSLSALEALRGGDGGGEAWPALARRGRSLRSPRRSARRRHLGNNSRGPRR